MTLNRDCLDRGITRKLLLKLGPTSGFGKSSYSNTTIEHFFWILSSFHRIHFNYIRTPVRPLASGDIWEIGGLRALGPLKAWV